MTIKYEIDVESLDKGLLKLYDEEGTFAGWGQYIKTDNQALIDFFNEYLAIEFEVHHGQWAYAVGAYSDETYDYWYYDNEEEYFAEKLSELIEEAIHNKGMYKGFGNKF